jgi:hypothetical protein
MRRLKPPRDTRDAAELERQIRGIAAPGLAIQPMRLNR